MLEARLLRQPAFSFNWRSAFRNFSCSFSWADCASSRPQDLKVAFETDEKVWNDLDMTWECARHFRFPSSKPFREALRLDSVSANLNLFVLGGHAGGLGVDWNSWRLVENIRLFSHLESGVCSELGTVHGAALTDLANGRLQPAEANRCDRRRLLVLCCQSPSWRCALFRKQKTAGASRRSNWRIRATNRHD